MRRCIRGIESPRVLGALWDEIEKYSLSWFWHTVATALVYAERAGKLRRELREMVGAEDADALLSDVSGAEGVLASLGPAIGLARVARGEMSREAYLEQWGHRGALETETSVARPAEDPAWLDLQLDKVADSAVDAEALLQSQRAWSRAAWNRFRERYPRKAEAMRRRLDRAAETIRSREAVRSEGARLVWVAREWALRAGDLTGIGDGAFHLTCKELLDLLAGRDTVTATLPERRKTYARCKELPPYPLLICGRFDPFQWAADPGRRSDVFDASGQLQQMTLKPPSADVVLGMPGAAGRVEGVVRRLDSSEEGKALKPGEVLVTTQTNIGWTLFFSKAAAIVTDVGAPLSHAAIVARELGIPAVVNCGDATARLRTGDRVRVDGVKGTVEILEQAAATD
jgi:pyruvate,water dikinase